MVDKVEIKDTHSKEAVALQLVISLNSLDRAKQLKALKLYEECLHVVNGYSAPLK